MIDQLGMYRQESSGDQGPTAADLVQERAAAQGLAVGEYVVRQAQNAQAAYRARTAGGLVIQNS